MLLLNDQHPEFSKESSFEVLLPISITIHLKMAITGLGKTIHKIPYIRCQAWQERF